MAPLKLVLDKYYAGDTWKGFTVDSVLINGLVPTALLVSCKLQFRDKFGDLGYTLLSDNVDTCKGAIDILDAAIWNIKIGGYILPLDFGTWNWDLEVIDADGVTSTILTGRLRITKDITK